MDAGCDTSTDGGTCSEAVGDYVLDHGIAELSLRKVAKVVGVSHVTLQHHFGTKDELIAEIIENLLERTFAPGGDYEAYQGGSGMRALWARWTSPPGERDIRLFIEILGQSLFEDCGYSKAIQRSVSHRLELLRTIIIKQGCPEDQAEAFATITQALLRGLIIERLATGDAARVDQAAEMMFADSDWRAARWAEKSSQAVAGTTSHNGASTD